MTHECCARPSRSHTYQAKSHYKLQPLEQAKAKHHSSRHRNTRKILIDITLKVEDVFKQHEANIFKGENRLVEGAALVIMQARSPVHRMPNIRSLPLSHVASSQLCIAIAGWDGGEQPFLVNIAVPQPSAAWHDNGCTPGKATAPTFQTSSPNCGLAPSTYTGGAGWQDDYS
eukprot:576522-Prymnesium_polylepis.2